MLFLHVVVTVAQGKYFPALTAQLKPPSNYVHTHINHIQSCFNWRSIKTLFTWVSLPENIFSRWFFLSMLQVKCGTAYICSPGWADDQIALIQRCSHKTSVSQGMGLVGCCLDKVLNESSSRGTDLLDCFSESPWSLSAYCQRAASAVSR